MKCLHRRFYFMTGFFVVNSGEWKRVYGPLVILNRLFYSLLSQWSIHVEVNDKGPVKSRIANATRLCGPFIYHIHQCFSFFYDNDRIFFIVVRATGREFYGHTLNRLFSVLLRRSHFHKYHLIGTDGFGRSPGVVGYVIVGKSSHRGRSNRTFRGKCNLIVMLGE